jgi:XTP/dITP diphosphohydrolase
VSDQVNLLIATTNPGKLSELDAMLRGTDIELISLADYPDVSEVPETGSTFQENACLKAAGYATQTGQITLADDSGLEVASLGGKPGVMSARYGGAGSDYNEKIAMLLSELDGRFDDLRRARFLSSIALSDPGGVIIGQADGVCEGIISLEPRGANGFGYDPIFIPDGYDRTFGELPATIKRKISHRSRAFRLIIPFLRHFTEN